MSAKSLTKARGSSAMAWLFLAPTLVGIAIFTLVPIVGSLLLAFFRWDIISDPEFAGVDNFVEAAQDPTVLVSFGNTIVFVVLAVALQLGLALLLAVLVQEKMPNWLRVFFRSAFFFPLILSAASVSIFMGYLFNEQFGVVNWLIGLVGIPAVPWLTTSVGATAVVMVIYETAFKRLEFGKASAIGLVLMLLIMAVTALQFRLSRRFVFYQ